MRAVFQRVSQAWVEVDGEVTARIGPGALILVGVEEGDTQRDAQYIAEKCVGLRIFDDEQGKLNRSVNDAGGSMLVVSQFTLCGDCRKGRRPSFAHAAAPDEGRRLYEVVVDIIEKMGVEVETGTFQANMKVHLVNDGPVTLLIDSRKVF
jgi:D-tyrosyl-tRNA(Tyr) deacylase